MTDSSRIKYNKEILLYAGNGFSMVRWHLRVYACAAMQVGIYKHMDRWTKNINSSTSLVDIATYNEICLRAHSTAHSFCSLTQSKLFLALVIFPDFSSAYSDCVSINFTLLWLNAGAVYILCHNIICKKAYCKITKMSFTGGVWILSSLSNEPISNLLSIRIGNF